MGGVPGARRRPVRGVDKSSVAAASHARTAAASAAMIALQRTRHRRRCRALQHGRPPRASSWRTPHDHAHCLELPVILLSFACIPACLAQALYSRRIPVHASIRDTKLAHALKRFRLYHDHTAKKTYMRLPRTLTDILCTYYSFVSRARFQQYVSLNLSWQGKRNSLASRQLGASSSDHGSPMWSHYCSRKPSRHFSYRTLRPLEKVVFPH